jgi:exopolysaccharide production protein ExoY
VKVNSASDFSIREAHLSEAINTVEGRSPRRIAPYRKIFKRALDITLTLLAVPFLVPLVILLALLVAADGGAPFYGQNRIGRDGRVYRMWKLRTMVPDAEARLADLIDGDPVAREEWTSRQKLRNDPRVTRIGRVLRTTSLDELPQFWNVLIGDMSIVGPRPIMPEQAPLYPGLAYYKLRPGLTGKWQVSARNESTFADRARYDDAYHIDVSLKADLSLLVATVRVVLRRTGY